MPDQISIVYFGTPSYAEPALRRLAGDDRFEVRLVVTQPDRPAGRGHRLVAPVVKVVAQELQLPVYQPETLRDEARREPLVEADADVFVVAAYGLIFGRKTLAIPRRGSLNLHASILPAFRGAAPIPAAILSGEAETGVTLMEMELGLDTGPIIDIARTPIRPDETTASLTDRLGSLGGELVVDALSRWFAGDLPATPQLAGGSVVRLLTKADGVIDWTRPATRIERHVRAMWPWPRATAAQRDALFQVHSVSDRGDPGTLAGLVEVRDGEVLVGTGTTAIRLETLQFAGGRPIPATQAVASRHLQVGEPLNASAVLLPPLVRPA